MCFCVSLAVYDSTYLSFHSDLIIFNDNATSNPFMNKLEKVSINYRYIFLTDCKDTATDSKHVIPYIKCTSLAFAKNKCGRH